MIKGIIPLCIIKSVGYVINNFHLSGKDTIVKLMVPNKKVDKYFSLLGKANISYNGKILMYYPKDIIILSNFKD